MVAMLGGCRSATKIAVLSSESQQSTQVSLSDVREYLKTFTLSERLRQEISAEEQSRPVLASRTPEEVCADISALADARARVLSDISYYPTRRPLLEVAGGILSQEYIVLQIIYYHAIPGEEEATAELVRRLRDIRTRHPELPSGTADRLLAELETK